MMFLGGALLVVGIGFGIHFRWNRPIAPIDTVDPESFQQGAAKFSPSRTWRIWRYMKQGLDRQTDQRFADEMTVYRWKQGFAAILALSGVILVGVGVAKGRGNANRQTETRGEGKTARGGDKERGRGGD